MAAGESDVASPGTRRFAIARYIGDTAADFDYDRDGAGDISVFRPSESNWYVLGSASNSASGFHWGNSTDKPVSADYDGDGRANVAVYRDGIWHIQQSTSGTRSVSFGLSTDIPTPTAYLP